LAGVKRWQSQDPSLGRQSTPGLGGVQPLAGGGSSGGRGRGDQLAELEAQKSGLMFG